MLVSMRRILVPTVFLIAALSLAGCSSAGGSASSAAIQPAPIAGQADSSVGSAAKSSGAADVIQRQVVTTGTVVVRAKNPVAAADTAAHLAEDAGGRVDDRTQAAATKTDGGSASLTLRIPASVLTDTLDKLKKLGHVESIKLSAEDVTTQSQDLNARITALQTSVNRLLALEAKADNTADLIALENDISDRQGDLDSLTAQEKYLSDQVAMSTITLRIVAPSTVIATGTPSPLAAFLAGLGGFGTFFAWFFLVLTYLLPWLVLAAVVTFGTIFLVRWRRRRAAAGTPAV